MTSGYVFSKTMYTTITKKIKNTLIVLIVVYFYTIFISFSKYSISSTRNYFLFRMWSQNSLDVRLSIEINNHCGWYTCSISQEAVYSTGQLFFFFPSRAFTCLAVYQRWMLFTNVHDCRVCTAWRYLYRKFFNYTSYMNRNKNLQESLSSMKETIFIRVNFPLNISFCEHSCATYSAI